MNKRIRKKKAKQQLIRAISGLVEAAEEMQREQERRTRQAGISYPIGWKNGPCCSGSIRCW